MTEHHPITPPEGLVEQWVAETWHEGTPVRVAASDLHITTQAAPVSAEGEVARCLADSLFAFSLTQDPAIYPSDHWSRRAVDLLQRLSPLQPVPVSERLPGPSDCAPWPKDSDASAWCWMGREVDGGWGWEQRSAGYLVAFSGDFTHWLPANALPVPTVEDVM